MPPIDSEDQELIDGFLTETTELLEKLDDDLVTLEKSSGDPDLLNRIFRSIHTVKGASSFLGFVAKTRSSSSEFSGILLVTGLISVIDSVLLSLSCQSIPFNSDLNP